jgi:hypothetical protein
VAPSGIVSLLFFLSALDLKRQPEDLNVRQMRKKIWLSFLTST